MLLSHAPAGWPCVLMSVFSIPLTLGPLNFPSFKSYVSLWREKKSTNKIYTEHKNTKEAKNVNIIPISHYHR